MNSLFCNKQEKSVYPCTGIPFHQHCCCNHDSPQKILNTYDTLCDIRSIQIVPTKGYLGQHYSRFPLFTAALDQYCMKQKLQNKPSQVLNKKQIPATLGRMLNKVVMLQFLHKIYRVYRFFKVISAC